MSLNSTNDTLAVNCGNVFLTLEIKIVMTIAIVVVLVLALFGNSVVIWAIHTSGKRVSPYPVHRSSKLPSPLKMFFQHMAVCDLLIPLLTLPKEIMQVWRGVSALWFIPGKAGKVLCKVSAWLIDTLIMTSICCMVLVAINRFIVFVIDSKTPNRPTRKRATIISLVMAWVFSAALYAPYLHHFSVFSDGGNPRCLHKALHPSFYTVEFAVRAAGPVLLFSFLYPVIIYKVIGRRFPKHRLSDRGRQQRSRERNITGLAVTTVLAFVLLWTPYYVVVFKYQFFHDSSPLPCVVNEVAQLSLVAQSAVNPYILFLFCKKYRDSLTRLLPRCMCHRKLYPSVKQRNELRAAPQAQPANTIERSAAAIDTYL